MTYSIKSVDKNQKAIVAALRQRGVFVLDTHTLGNGAPDIFTCYRAEWVPMEIKSGKGKLTPDERDWWNRVGLEPIVIRDYDEALEVLGIAV